MAQRRKRGPGGFDARSFPTVSPAVAQDVIGQARQARITRLDAQAVAPGIPAPAKPTKPGTERWPVKTGADRDARHVGNNQQAGGQKGAVESTVEQLVELPRPADMTDVHAYQDEYQDRRAAPVEITIWRVRAKIIAIKKEADGDLHIVLQGVGGDTMIAEAPTAKPPFVPARNAWLAAMRRVRRAIGAQFGPTFAAMPFQIAGPKYMMPAEPGPATDAPSPPLFAGPANADDPFEWAQPFKAAVAPTDAIVTGVGFFDRVHGQMGVATKNGIELHPILDIEFPGGGGVPKPTATKRAARKR